MKKLLFAVLFSSISASAVVVEPGFYTAVDVPTGEIQSTLEIRADKSLIFNVSTPDFTMPAPGCVGAYTLVGTIFDTDLECPFFLLPQVNVQIDIKDVTPEALRSEDGVLVMVVIDALGTEPTQYRLKKISK